MKNKTKKILAGACLGLVGMGAMTGCSVKLTESQRDKIMSVVENSDTFMDESLDLLKESNEKLDKESAFGLLRLAIKRLGTNAQDIFDNLKINVVTDWDATDGYFGMKFNINYFKDSNGKHYFYTAKGDGTVTDIIYSEGLNDVVTVVKGEQCTNTQNYITNVNKFGFYFFAKGEIELDNIVNYSNLENGNYCITYFSQTENEEVLNFAEINKDGYLIKVTSELLADDGDENYITTLDYTFEYGILEESGVLALIQANSN
ncbi:MAG: hypothetical protein IJW59_00305 [Clostridia bacterium]|nr:hypothetical protein [Clostridia bacterium]